MNKTVQFELNIELIIYLIIKVFSYMNLLFQ